MFLNLSYVSSFRFLIDKISFVSYNHLGRDVKYMKENQDFDKIFLSKEEIAILERSKKWRYHSFSFSELFIGNRINGSL